MTRVWEGSAWDSDILPIFLLLFGVIRGFIRTQGIVGGAYTPPGRAAAKLSTSYTGSGLCS